MQHHPQTPQPDPSDALLQQVEAALHEQFHRATAIDPRVRRFSRALADLGLPVPADWATVEQGVEGADAVTFGSLSWATFDRLLCLLEDLAEGRPVQVTVMKGGPTLFDPGSAPAPYVERTASTVHMQVPA